MVEEGERIFRNLPESISGLGEMAMNLWWVWPPSARRLFKMLDRQEWKESRHNAVKMLRELPRELLEVAARDPGYLRHYHAILAQYREEVGGGETFPRGIQHDGLRPPDVRIPQRRQQAPWTGGPGNVAEPLARHAGGAGAHRPCDQRRPRADVDRTQDGASFQQGPGRGLAGPPRRPFPVAKIRDIPETPCRPWRPAGRAG